MRPSSASFVMYEQLAVVLLLSHVHTLTSRDWATCTHTLVETEPHASIGLLTVYHINRHSGSPNTTLLYTPLICGWWCSLGLTGCRANRTHPLNAGNTERWILTVVKHYMPQLLNFKLQLSSRRVILQLLLYKCTNWYRAYSVCLVSTSSWVVLIVFTSKPYIGSRKH